MDSSPVRTAAEHRFSRLKSELQLTLERSITTLTLKSLLKHSTLLKRQDFLLGDLVDDLLFMNLEHLTFLTTSLDLCLVSRRFYILLTTPVSRFYFKSHGDLIPEIPLATCSPTDKSAAVDSKWYDVVDILSKQQHRDLHALLLRVNTSQNHCWN
jgi:hypothetical protein